MDSEDNKDKLYYNHYFNDFLLAIGSDKVAIFNEDNVCVELVNREDIKE